MKQRSLPGVPKSATGRKGQPHSPQRPHFGELVPSEPALGHAGPEHEHALYSSPGVVGHLLPQALLFPLRIHPVHVLPMAHT